jgi:hypothetical protein
MLEISVHGPRGRPPLLSRRAFVRASLAGAGAFCLPELLKHQSAARAAGRAGRDTAVIQVWLGGGPSHIDMYDMKPAMPAEIRGPFTPHPTNVPGIQICELMPRQARLMHRLAIVRSLHHGTNDHAAGMHWMQTGHAPIGLGQNARVTHPSVGSVVARARGANRPAQLPYVHIAQDPMGIPIFLRIFNEAYLGPAYAPLLIQSARAKADPNRLTLDNLIGKAEFSVPNLELVPGIDAARLHNRGLLLGHMDRLQRAMAHPAVTDALSLHQRRALELVSSPAARAAFDLDRESARLRDRYGRNAWGQGLLLCRRLVEAGVTFVSLNTDSFSGQWDNHSNLESEFKQMLPVYDQMLTALVEDLVDRGLYERVLLLVWGEFGRTPKMSGGGRDHWGASGFALLGGGGLRGGVVVGSTDPRGEAPRDRPQSPPDILATVYHVLGIDPETAYPDQVGRLIKILGEGEPIRELL